MSKLREIGRGPPAARLAGGRPYGRYLVAAAAGQVPRTCPILGLSAAGINQWAAIPGPEASVGSVAGEASI